MTDPTPPPAGNAPMPHPGAAPNTPQSTPPVDKSVGAALALTFFFGPLGLFYTNVVGAIVMSVVAVLVGLVTVGFGLAIIWPAVMIWSAVIASRKHQEFEMWKIGRLTGQHPV